MLIFSCSSGNSVPVIKIGHAPHDHHSPLYIAAAKGEFFKEKTGFYLQEVEYRKKYHLYNSKKLIGILEVSSGTGGINLIRKLDEKLLDVSFGGVPAMVEMIDKGSSIKIVAPVMAEGAALVVDNSMPAANWAEFAEYVKKSQTPVKIGYKIDISVQNLILETALHKEGLTYNNDLNAADTDVILVNLHGPNNLIPALESGVIDGFVVMQPYPALAEYSKSGKIIANLKDLPPDGQWESHPCCAFAARNDFIHEHGDVLEAMITLFRAAGEYINENPYESADIVAKWLDMPEEVERDSLPTIKFLSRYTDEWNRGIEVWIHSLIDKGSLAGELKKSHNNNTVDETLYDKTHYDRVNKRQDVDK
jgi:NitT/TauT family transport system substrate-binding protein